MEPREPGQLWLNAWVVIAACFFAIGKYNRGFQLGEKKHTGHELFNISKMKERDLVLESQVARQETDELYLRECVLEFFEALLTRETIPTQHNHLQLGRLLE